MLSKGFAALPHMRRALATAGPEVRRRIMRHLPGLEHALLVKPHRYRVSVKDKDLDGVLKAIAKATGYKLSCNGAAGAKKFSYEFEDATFWQMLDRVCRDSGCQVQGGWGDETVTLSPAAGPSRHTGTDGAFRYAATQFQMYRSVSLAPAKGDATGGRAASLNLDFTLHAEPRLPFLGQEPPHVSSAYDDTKASMLFVADPDEGRQTPWGGRFVTRMGRSPGYKQLLLHVSVPLSPGAAKARMLKSIKGNVPVTLLVAQKRIVIDADILNAKNRKKEVEGIEFVIRETKAAANNQYLVRMTITNKANPGDYNWMNTVYQRIVLEDAKGEKFQNYGSSWSGMGNAGTAELTLHFGHFGKGGGKPAKLAYTHWVTKTHRVAFEFKDVPLP